MPTKKTPSKNIVTAEAMGRLCINQGNLGYIELCLKEDDTIEVICDCGDEMQIAVTKADAKTLADWFAAAADLILDSPPTKANL